MKRLTMKLGICEMVSTEYCHEHRDCYYCGHGRKVFKRLAAYEDTGLEPEEIISGKELCETACATILLKQYQELGTMEELAALVKAQDEGRLVVLPEPMMPMVMGDEPEDTDVYCPRCGHDLSGGWHEEHPEEWKLCQCPNCGQSINDGLVVTRAEAEAALKGDEI